MQPGELTDLQWVFTQPGTYEISVHLQGWVRGEEDAPDPRPDGWKPISGDGTQRITETSEVKRYVIQVGTPLSENEPPSFGAGFSVTENSVAGTPVGTPLHVFADTETLSYSLSGEGHQHFVVEPVTGADDAQVTNPHAVQIKVAHGANLDYETRPNYDLTLSVTDNVDHESNPDPSLDDTLAVRIALEDVTTPSAVLKVSNPNPRAGEKVTITAVVKEFGDGLDVTVAYDFAVSGEGDYEESSHTLTLWHGGGATRTVNFEATYDLDGTKYRIAADPVTITWHNQ